MTAPTGVEMRPIGADDVPLVAEFFHRHLNSRLSAAQWARSMIPPWNSPEDSHGYLLASGGEVVGANLVFYSEREVHGRQERFGNLAALCVLPEHRPHTVRLLRAVLRRRDLHCTDLSPSGNVVELDRRLGFEPLDVTTYLLPFVPRPRPVGVRLLTRPEEVVEQLDDHERRIFEDHQGALAARHLLVVRGDERCYVVYRRDSRKRLRVFASVLHVGDPGLLVTALPSLQAHLLLHDRAPLLLVERRLLGTARPPLTVTVQGRPKLFRSPTLRADEIDNLYSELTCVAW